MTQSDPLRTSDAELSQYVTLYRGRYALTRGGMSALAKMPDAS